MNISKFVKLVDCCEHLADIESRVFLFQDPRIVEQCPEVTSRHVFHGKVYILRVLEGIQQTNQPGCLCGGQDISFNKNVSDLQPHCENERMQIRLTGTNLVHLEQCTLTHLLQRTYFSSFLFAGKVDFSVTPLSNLSDDMELFDPELSPSTT